MTNKNNSKTSKNSGAAKHGKSRSRSKPMNSRRVMIAAAAVVALLFVLMCVLSIHPKVQTDGFSHRDSYSEYEVISGIDVSYAQGEDIRWRKVKNSGIDFAFVRAGFRGATEGILYEDELCRDNLKGAHKAGLMTGAYFYSQAISEQEAREEAEKLIEIVEPYDIDLPLVIDFEFYNGGRLQKAVSSGELTSEDLNAIVVAFTDTVEEAGYESAVYANYDMLTNYLYTSVIGPETNIWVAQYHSSAQLEADYLCWQCTDRAAVPGISGNVDLDFMYIDPKGVVSSTVKTADGKTSVGDLEAAVKKKKVHYRGIKCTPKVRVTDEGRRLKRGRDYEISYVRNTAKGTGYAVIRGIGEYRDMKIVPFKIRGIL